MWIPWNTCQCRRNEPRSLGKYVASYRLWNEFWLCSNVCIYCVQVCVCVCVCVCAASHLELSCVPVSRWGWGCKIQDRPVKEAPLLFGGLEAHFLVAPTRGMCSTIWPMSWYDCWSLLIMPIGISFFWMWGMIPIWFCSKHSMFQGNIPHPTSIPTFKGQDYFRKPELSVEQWPNWATNWLGKSYRHETIHKS